MPVSMQAQNVRQQFWFEPGEVTYRDLPRNDLPRNDLPRNRAPISFHSVTLESAEEREFLSCRTWVMGMTP